MSTGGIFPCLFFLWVPSLFALYHTEFYSSEAGLQQALNATAILFGDKTALAKISGIGVSVMMSMSVALFLVSFATFP